ncbi:MAG: hypothetical protein NT155_03855 [Candidatus Staskawiczbacteria bacterium]|nr:hypothetical protein [Candidatus Staskawiczbacteria bacterium]
MKKTKTCDDMAKALIVGLAQNGNQAHGPGAEPTPAQEAKPVKKATAPPKPAKPGGLLNLILKAGKNMKGDEVAEAIQEAGAVLTDAGAVATFVEAINLADALAMQKLGFDDPTVKDWWFQLELPKLEEQLQHWASNGDASAKQILATLSAFRQSQVDVMGPLWRLVNEIVRPANDVRTYHDLSELMKDLLAKGLVDPITPRGRYMPKNAVAIGDYKGYLPAAERGHPIPMVQAGWPFIKAAEARAQKRVQEQEERVATLERETANLSPNEAFAKQEGDVFLKVGPRSGALLHITNRQIRIVEVIGLKLSGPRNSLFLSSGRNSWPNEDLFRAFEAWRKPIFSDTPPANQPAPEEPAATEAAQG